MGVKLKLIAAACENMGIGKNGDLPWRLKKEMEYFSRMTTNTKTVNKKNVVIMGRKTWESIPKKFKPLKDRINFVLSKSNLEFSEYKDVFGFKTLKQAIETLESPDFQGLYEEVWIIGGFSVYKEAMNDAHFYRLYLTRIHKNFDCDTFFPALPESFKKVSEPGVPEEIQEENGIQYTFHIYEKSE